MGLMTWISLCAGATVIAKPAELKKFGYYMGYYIGKLSHMTQNSGGMIKSFAQDNKAVLDMHDKIKTDLQHLQHIKYEMTASNMVRRVAQNVSSSSSSSDASSSAFGIDGLKKDGLLFKKSETASSGFESEKEKETDTAERGSGVASSEGSAYKEASINEQRAGERKGENVDHGSPDADTLAEAHRVIELQAAEDRINNANPGKQRGSESDLSGSSIIMESIVDQAVAQKERALRSSQQKDK
eukprot:Nk52_evm8s123 gene=Nk52_evmTU8s123